MDIISIASFMGCFNLEHIMERRKSVDEWMDHPIQNELGEEYGPDGSWHTLMSRVAKFHHKHDFANPENNGHDMGYRISLTVEELGELSGAITKGKPKEEIAEELADLFILTLGNALAMEIDLEKHVHMKLEKHASKLIPSHLGFVSRKLQL